MQLTTKVYDGLQQVLDDLPIPMIIGKSLPGLDGKPSNYEYLSINNAYEEKSGLKMDTLVGKRLLDVYPHLKKDPFEQAEFIEEVAYGDKPQDTTSFYSALWNGWIQLNVIKLGEGKFIALYYDTSELRSHLDKLTKIVSSLEMTLSKSIEDIDYQHMTDTLRELADAKFVGFNVLEYANQTSRTVAISTDSETKELVHYFFQEQIIGKIWNENPATWMPYGDVLTKEYNRFSEVTEDEEIKKLFEAIENDIGIGETIVSKISVKERVFGYFLFSMPRGIPYRNHTIVDIYTRVMGLAIARKEDETRIKVEKERFESLFENMGSGSTILEVTKQGQMAKDYLVKDINKMGLKYHNVSKEDAIGKSLYEVNVDYDRSGLIHYLKETWETGKDTYTLMHIISHDQRFKWYEDRIFKLPSGDLVASYNDVTEKVTAEKALAESERSLKQLIRNMEQGLAVHEIILDEKGNPVDYRFLMVNPSFERLTGLEGAKILGKTCKEVLPDIEPHWIERYGRVALTGETIEFDEYSSILKRHYHVIAYQPHQGVFATIFTDITDPKLAQAQVQFRSDHDSLTGLFNRRYFDEELARYDYEGNYPLTLILADIDDLKLINDVHGHQAGDKVIQQVAGLMNEVSPDDCIIARTGGDEFTLLLIGQDEIHADDLIKRIKKIVTEKISVSGKPISVSMGFATKKEPHQRIGDVFRQAENMMYKNKIMWNRSSIGTVEMIMQALREKSPREKIHADQVALISKEIGEELGLGDDNIKELLTAALMHDIGKIGVPDYILEKPDILSKEEYEVIQRHSESGYKILVPIPELESVAITVLTHHERFDGKGYPNSIDGAKIPLHGRIICVADSFSAIISERPYRKKIGFEAARQEIVNCSGKQFDPLVVDAFLNRFPRICTEIKSI